MLVGRGQVSLFPAVAHRPVGTGVANDLLAHWTMKPTLSGEVFLVCPGELSSNASFATESCSATQVSQLRTGRGKDATYGRGATIRRADGILVETGGSGLRFGWICQCLAAS